MQVCRRCGATGETVLGWMIETGPDGSKIRLCPDCARAHARDIEARLDERWWGEG